MEALSELERHVAVLLEQYQQLRQENQELREANDRQRQEIMRTHSDFLTLQNDYKALRMAKGLAGQPEQQEIAKRHLNAMIAQIDKAIEILKQ